MRQYLDLLRDVRTNGVLKPTRAKLLSTGDHVSALSVFGRQMRFDLRDGFPLATTKFVNFDAIVHELIWFLRGETSLKYLHYNNVHIWDEWQSDEGHVLFSYPQTWRAFGDLGESYKVDQIAGLVDDINDVVADPQSRLGRRLILTSWNPLTVEYASLPACHVMSQFSVTNGRLSCMMTQRSGDAFLGIPFNIASYSLLTYVLAHITGLEVGEFVHSIGDAHIYLNHIDQVDEQLKRDPLPSPALFIRQGLTEIDDLQFNDVILSGYTSHGRLKAEVAV